MKRILVIFQWEKEKILMHRRKRKNGYPMAFFRSSSIWIKNYLYLKLWSKLSLDKDWKLWMVRTESVCFKEIYIYTIFNFLSFPYPPLSFSMNEEWIYFKLKNFFGSLLFSFSFPLFLLFGRCSVLGKHIVGLKETGLHLTFWIYSSFFFIFFIPLNN